MSHSPGQILGWAYNICLYGQIYLFIFLQFLVEHLAYPVVSIIIIYSLEFSPSAFADGLSLEFEWQQVSSSLRDSSPNSGRSQ